MKLLNREINKNDIFYMYQKAFFPYLRGLIWSIVRFRKPSHLMLGKNIKFIKERNINFKKGIYIGQNSYIETDSKKRVIIKENVTIRENAWIQCRSGLNEKGEGLLIEENVYIGPFSCIGVGGAITIGKNCQIGSRLSLSAESHLLSKKTFVGGDVSRKGITINDNCWIGNNVTILDGVNIGSNCVIGAGSVVTKSISDNTIAYGVPAQEKRKHSFP